MSNDNPTAKGRWLAALEQIAPASAMLPLRNVHWIGPFENHDYRGLETAYPPESSLDLAATYPGKSGTVAWQPAPALEGILNERVSLAPAPAPPWSVVYVYAEVEAQEAQLAQVAAGSRAIAYAWFNGQPVLAPSIPFSANPADSRAWVPLQAGTNRLLLKLLFAENEWKLECRCTSYGSPQAVIDALDRLADTPPDAVTRLVTRFAQVEAYAVLGDVQAALNALERLRRDPLATRWDVAWADALEQQQARTGSFLPLHDVPVSYTPVMTVEPYPNFWPQSGPPAKELLVVDVSAAPPQVEFALAVLQGLVNRKQPRLYLLHTRYERQDRMWLEELHVEGYTSRPIEIAEAWATWRGELKGAVLYDGSIMDEIGAFHSAQLNQTNVLMMIGALEDAVPLTPEMNAALNLPVVMDARGRWANQYEMMRWAYVELFPRMNHRILATNYPGIFLITDYLVAFQIFTFWFPNYRTQPEDNLLRGILASTPPNTPIVGWWFDWMPTPKDPQHLMADAVMEDSGVLYGSVFGKVLTPSHEATNLSVHSGVAAGPDRHKAPPVPEYDPARVYFGHVISDGDNLGEALMMRTRDLQWDRPERGRFPMGWSFAPAASRLAPPVLNYYLRTASANDLLVGGLGVGYTMPQAYLRAYPEQLEELFAAYARQTDEALGWIDSTCLWLFAAREEEEDRYARGSSGRLQGIFTGYGGSPEGAAARLAPNNVVAFRSATGFDNAPQEEIIQTMVNEIRAAAGDRRPAFIEAWVLNWGWKMDMLEEVHRRLGPEFVCVRPDVLAQLRQRAGK